MLTQSFLYKLSDLAKSSRFLFLMIIFSFGLVHTSEKAKKPAPMKSSNQINKKKHTDFVRSMEEIIVASMNCGKESQNSFISSDLVTIVNKPGATVLPPWPE